MKHYVSVPLFELLPAKDLAERVSGVRPQNYSAGPRAWFVHVDEATAITLLVHIPGATCKTVKLADPVEAAPDSTNILTERKAAS
jgi:hypothetical protein